MLLKAAPLQLSEVIEPNEVVQELDHIKRSESVVGRNSCDLWIDQEHKPVNR